LEKDVVSWEMILLPRQAMYYSVLLFAEPGGYYERSPVPWEVSRKGQLDSAVAVEPPVLVGGTCGIDRW
jgi:hypothetical protein